MKSKGHGKNTSSSSLVEVQSISKHGIWIFVNGREFLLPFETHPWFREATIKQIHNVEIYHDKRLRWEDLDVDLALDSLVHADKYPLVSSLVSGRKRRRAS